jgi:hypothetical protein
MDYEMENPDDDDDEQDYNEGDDGRMMTYEQSGQAQALALNPDRQLAMDHEIGLALPNQNPNPNQPFSFPPEQGIATQQGGNVTQQNINNYRQRQVVNHQDKDYTENANRIHQEKISYRKMLSFIECPHERGKYSSKLEGSDRRLKTAKSKANKLRNEIVGIDKKYTDNNCPCTPSTVCNGVIIAALTSVEAVSEFTKRAIHPDASPAEHLTGLCEDTALMSTKTAALTSVTMELIKESYLRQGLIQNISDYRAEQAKTKRDVLADLALGCGDFSALGL